jgi:arylsulfatase A-like enzyme
MRWPVILVTAVALLLALGVHLLPLSLETDRSRPNVVLVVVDALRADRLGVYGWQGQTSPNIDRLGDNGLVVRDAYTCATSTKLAIPCLLTSLFPLSHGVTDEASVLSREALTLTEMLANAGYATWFYNAGNIYLHSRFGYTQGFDTVFFRFPVNAEELTDEFLEDLDKGGSSGPFFAYLHFMDVHTPYNLNDFSRALDLAYPGLEPGGRNLSNPELLELDAEGRSALSELYNAQISYVDQQIGRLLSGLVEAGLDDETLVVLTSDHGEEFWEHGHFGHGRAPFEETFRIPLILAGPAVANVEVDHPARILDILPTVTSLLGVHRGKAAIQGASMIEPVGDGRDAISRPIVGMMSMGGSGVFGVLHQSMKLLTAPFELDHLATRDPRPIRLFDLSQDPEERVDLLAQRPGQAAELMGVLMDFLRSGPSLARGETVIDPRERELLEALGYMEQ